MPQQDLCGTIMAAARSLPGSRFTAADLMAVPEVADLFPTLARVESQARYLADCGWLRVVATLPVPMWGIGPAWIEEARLLTPRPGGGPPPRQRQPRSHREPGGLL